MARFHDNIQMHPTPCQMQVIRRFFPNVEQKDCAIRYEGGTHYSPSDGRDYDGWFCVHIFQKGRWYFKDGKCVKEEHKWKLNSN